MEWQNVNFDKIRESMKNKGGSIKTSSKNLTWRSGLRQSMMKRDMTSTGGLPAVVYVDSVNLNRELLRRGYAEVMYIPPSEFNPYGWT